VTGAAREQIERAACEESAAAIASAAAVVEQMRLESKLDALVNAPAPIGTDPTNSLPDEIMALVLAMVDRHTLLRSVPAVCGRWRALCLNAIGVDLDLGRCAHTNVSRLTTALLGRFHHCNSIDLRPRIADQAMMSAHCTSEQIFFLWDALDTIANSNKCKSATSFSANLVGMVDIVRVFAASVSMEDMYQRELRPVNPTYADKVARAVASMPRLRSLALLFQELGGVYDTKLHFRNILAGCPQLKVLEIGAFVGDATLLVICESCPQLEAITIPNAQFSDTGLLTLFSRSVTVCSCHTMWIAAMMCLSVPL
jgi:hypothetical protein